MTALAKDGRKLANYTAAGKIQMSIDFVDCRSQEVRGHEKDWNDRAAYAGVYKACFELKAEPDKIKSYAWQKAGSGLAVRVGAVVVWIGIGAQAKDIKLEDAKAFVESLDLDAIAKL